MSLIVNQAQTKTFNAGNMYLARMKMGYDDTFWQFVGLTCGKGVTAMVKQLPQGTVCTSTSRLFAINGIKTLVDEKPQGTQEAGPPWHLYMKTSDGMKAMDNYVALIVKL